MENGNLYLVIYRKKYVKSCLISERLVFKVLFIKCYNRNRRIVIKRS